jgi:hypothetical protein
MYLVLLLFRACSEGRKTMKSFKFMKDSNAKYISKLCKDYLAQQRHVLVISQILTFKGLCKNEIKFLRIQLKHKL